MSTKQCEDMLVGKGVRPTAARILVLQKLSERTSPASLFELEAELETLDKSTISRSLALLLEHHAIHSFEDGSGSIKYEICQSRSETCPVGDRHIHFFCEVCRKTSCLNNIKIPVAQLPEGYIMDTINYTVRVFAHCVISDVFRNPDNLQSSCNSLLLPLYRNQEVNN